MRDKKCERCEKLQNPREKCRKCREGIAHREQASRERIISGSRGRNKF